MDAPASPPAVPVDKTRHDGWTQDRRRLFLEALANGHSVPRACERVGMSKVSAYKLRRRDPDFARAWSDALQAVAPRIFGPLPPSVLDMEVRIVTQKDGSVIRHCYFDNRRALAHLLRADREFARRDMDRSLAGKGGCDLDALPDDLATDTRSGESVAGEKHRVSCQVR